jgi:hypothetical protein
MAQYISFKGIIAMIPSALSLFLLRELPFSHFTFPRWQA